MLIVRVPADEPESPQPLVPPPLNVSPYIAGLDSQAAEHLAEISGSKEKKTIDVGSPRMVTKPLDARFQAV